jgi:hypothetical protein
MENRPPDKTLKFQLGPREALTIVGVATLAFAYLQAKFGVRAESGINPTGTLNGEVIGPDCAICTPDATETCVPTPTKATRTPVSTDIPTDIPTEEVKPTPTPTEKVEPSSTPTEKVVPTPTPTDIPTEEVKPTPTPTEKVVPTPTPTDIPTEEVKPTPTPTPTDIPTEEVKPTPTPTPTDIPTEEVKPTPTPTPTGIPTETDEPVPTRGRNRPVGTLVPDTGAGQVEGNGFGGLLPELVTVVGAASGLSAARLVWMRRRRHSKAIHTPQK